MCINSYKNFHRSLLIYCSYNDVFRDLPGIDPNLLPVVRKLLKTFSVLSYGDFDDFDELSNVTELSKINHLNLTELLLKVITLRFLMPSSDITVQFYDVLYTF